MSVERPGSSSHSKDFSLPECGHHTPQCLPTCFYPVPLQHAFNQPLSLEPELSAQS